MDISGCRRPVVGVPRIRKRMFGDLRTKSEVRQIGDVATCACQLLLQPSCFRWPSGRYQTEPVARMAPLSHRRMTALGRVLPATSLPCAAAVQRIAGIQCPVAVGSVRVWTERPPRVDRSAERPPLMMYFHRSTSGKLSDPLPCHCPAQRITKRGRPVQRIAWESKNLPSAQLNPSIPR